MASEPVSPLVVIVGQTASGKSELAMKLARKYGGEIIAADSRTIYKGMDIGTAKPSKADQAETRHYGLDLAAPNQVYSAAEFKRYARPIIQDIQSRNRIPILVGGTGLYVDGLLYNFKFGGVADPALRKKLEDMSLDELQTMAEQIGISEQDINYKNRRHLSRAIERGGMIQAPRKLPDGVLIIGTEVDKEELNTRIESRVDNMLAAGLENEVQKLLKDYSQNSPGLLSPGYKEFVRYTHGEISLAEAKDMFIARHKKLAKKQKTWFKRNKDIQWVQTFEQSDKLVSDFLSKFATIEQ